MQYLEPSDLYGFVVFFLRGGVAGFTQDLLEMRDLLLKFLNSCGSNSTKLERVSNVQAYEFI